MNTNKINEDDVKWIVNEYGELGVMIGDKRFYLYKGDCLDYAGDYQDDENEPQYRPVLKREFGECCISPLLQDMLNTNWESANRQDSDVIYAAWKSKYYKEGWKDATK